MTLPVRYQKDFTNVPCEVCRGTGHTYLEHADGSLSEEVCPYCHGARNTVWLQHKAQAREDRLRAIKNSIWVFVAFYVLTWYGTWWRHDYALKWIHGLMFIPWLVGLLWIYANPSPSKRRQQRHAAGPRNPLTTDRERVMGGAVLGGLAVKHLWESRRR